MIDAPSRCHGEEVSIIPCPTTEGKCQCTMTVGSWKHMSGLGLSANRTSDHKTSSEYTMPSCHSVPKLITLITSTCCAQAVTQHLSPLRDPSPSPRFVGQGASTEVCCDSKGAHSASTKPSLWMLPKKGGFPELEMYGGQIEGE